jgi:hypothetical protein
MSVKIEDALEGEKAEKDHAEKCMLGYMWNLVLSSLQHSHIPVREDMLILAERASGRDLQGLDPFTVRKISARVETEGHAILKEGGSNIIVMVAALARMTLNLAGNGYPVTENLILLAMAFNEEIKEDPSDYGGIQMIETVAGKLINEANRREFLRVTREMQIDAQMDPRLKNIET